MLDPECRSLEESSMAPVVLEDVRALKEFVGREIGVTEWLSLT